MATGLISIEVAAKLHSMAVDVQAIRRKYFLEGELKIEEILRVLKDHGFRVRLKSGQTVENLVKYPAPSILVARDGTYHVLLGSKDDKVLLFETVKKAVVEFTADELKNFWDGRVIPLFPRFTKTDLFLNFRWLFREFLKYRSIFSEIVTASFFIQTFGLVTPLFIQVIIDKVLAHHAVTTLQVVAGVFLIVVLFDAVLNLMRNYLLYHTANKIDGGLGAKVYRHLLSLPYRYFETRKVGNIIARVRELENLRQFMTNISLTVLLDTVFSVVFVVIMALYSLMLTVLVLCFIAVIGAISFFVTPVIKRRLDDKFQKGAAAQSFLVETVTGIQTVKSLAIEGRMVRNWENHLGDYILSAFRLSNVGNAAFTASQLLQKMMTLAVIYFGVSLVFENRLSVGQLIAFQMFASQLSGPILRLVHMWQDFQQAKLSLERIGDIINTPSEVVGGSVAVKEMKGEIIFRDVKFKYSPEGPLILDGISLRIAPGSRVGIVGKSGSGKSTITKLIQRLYVPTEGVLTVDGIDTRHMDPLQLRYKIGMVPQECFLFSGTIRENISMAVPDASMDRIIGACRVAGAHEFITEMPLGYETYVEERGISLSGGQRQRIAIARALLTNPPILIFDEATSSLDYESEKIIQRNLAHIGKGRTMILVAHRLSIMKECDVIFVIDRGRVVEAGNHEVLVKKNGLYGHLYRQQEGEHDGLSRFQAHTG